MPIFLKSKYEHTSPMQKQTNKQIQF